jgi:lipopolysaccharide transport system ATP-binding protein
VSETIIKLENISKQYRLGQVGTWWLSGVEVQSLRGDFQSRRLSVAEAWWHRMRGKEDPTLKIGQTNQLNSKQETVSRKLETDYVWALKDINLEVKQGEVLAIIGKNIAETLNHFMSDGH